MTAEPHGAAAHTLANELMHSTGLNPAKCYQCGKCSAGCPMAEEMNYGPHQIIRLVQMGQVDRLFADDSIWLCATCETCTARCPNSCDPARMIDGLRELSLRRAPSAGNRRVKAFNKAFLWNVRTLGRLYEVGAIAGYKMLTGALFDDVLAVPGMLAREKLALIPKKIDGVEHVRQIFDACMREEET